MNHVVAAVYIQARPAALTDIPVVSNILCTQRRLFWFGVTFRDAAKIKHAAKRVRRASKRRATSNLAAFHLTLWAVIVQTDNTLGAAAAWQSAAECLPLTL
jgi:hypothetical protein